MVNRSSLSVFFSRQMVRSPRDVGGSETFQVGKGARAQTRAFACVLGGWVGGQVGGWVDGWVGGWGRLCGCVCGMP